MKRGIKKTKRKRHRRKKAVCYVRTSIDKQIDNTSIEKQIEEIKKYCEQDDIELVDIYIDKAKSGKSFEGRDAFFG